MTKFIYAARQNEWPAAFLKAPPPCLASHISIGTVLTQRYLICLLLVLPLLALTGCKKNEAVVPAQMPPTQVVVVEATRQTVAETLSVVGTVAANEMVEIKSETDGLVEEIPFQEGQHVEKGQLLVGLDQSKLASSVAEAEANFKLSQANYSRARQLYQDRLISQQEFDQSSSIFDFNRASLELKKRQLKDTRIYAPFEGVVGARSISPGQVMTKSTTLTWLIDLDPVKVEFNVPERFLSQLRVGQTIAVGVATYPDRLFMGSVFFVSSFVDPAMRTALVKAQIENPKEELKPGMFAHLNLTLKIRENSVVIPEVALGQLLDQDRASIFIVDAAQTVQAKIVDLGVRLAGQAEILSGLQGGEKVIVEGLQKVGPGAKVTFAPPAAAKPYQAK